MTTHHTSMLARFRGACREGVYVREGAVGEEVNMEDEESRREELCALELRAVSQIIK